MMKTSPSSYSCCNSSTRRLMQRQCQTYPNVMQTVPPLCYSLPAAQFTRQYWSQQSNSEDDANSSDSDAADNYYRLYTRLVQQSLPFSGQTLSSLDDSRSLAKCSRPVGDSLSHVSDSGKVKMVDVGAKMETDRVAVASGRVMLGKTAFQLVGENRLKKGDVLATAQLAGIMAAKRTSELIPLCHNVVLLSVDVTLTLDSASMSVVIECTAKSKGRTGVEMEALTGVSVAALTVYDMCKSVSHDIVIGDIQLVSKTGGKSDFHR